MDFTWLAILASLAMGIGTALIFVFAVKGNYFQNLEDAKYQVFWSESSETLTRRKLLAWLTGMGVFGSVEPRSPLLRLTRGIPIRGA